jgi:hypothetical protein
MAWQISAKICWAMCYGYIAGRNGHVLQLSGLYVVLGLDLAQYLDVVATVDQSVMV